MSKKYYACVFGGASTRLDEVYIKETEKLGKILADNGYSLVYGAGGSGCMGGVARGVKENDGYVMGVSPHFIKEFEPIFDCDNTIMVDTMAERKTLMEKHADIFIITPGGIGTLDEFFQVLTLKYLGQILCPIVVLNTNGFYDSLIELVKDLADKKACSVEIMKYFNVIDSVDSEILSDYLKQIKEK